MEGKQYLLISVPKSIEDTYNKLNRKTADEHDISANSKFPIPDLKVGTLDVLMSLSDDLHKVDSLVEHVVKKLATQLFDVLEDMPNKYDSLTAGGNDINTYLNFFKWDEARYPTSQPLRALVDLIQGQVAKLDEELKVKSAEYNTLAHQISADERKQGGNWLTKDLSEVVKQEHIVETEYLETLFVAVPKSSEKEWNSSYEKLSQFVLPRSSLKVIADNEYAIYRVVLFKKVEDDFKNLSREKKFSVREFKFEPTKNTKEDKKKLLEEKEKLRKNLIRFTKTNFSEAFIGWIHLKAIGVFVESVLRYGLPTNFQAVLLLPHKNRMQKLRKALFELYGDLSNKSAFSHGDDDAGEDFFPYVSLDINLSFKSNSGF